MRLLPARPTDMGEMRLLPVFGNHGLLDTNMVNLKSSEERAEMFPDRAPASQDVTGVQVAQGWNGIPSIPAPRLPASTRGYDTERKKALEDLDSSTENMGQNEAFRAASRQSQVAGQFDVEKRAAAAQSGVSIATMPRQPYYTDSKTIAPVGRGDTYRVSGPTGEKYYVDRNGDGRPDLITQYRKGGTYADFGDDSGLSLYSPERYRDAPSPSIRRLLGK